jgi:YD repeat-containing protein
VNDPVSRFNKNVTVSTEVFMSHLAKNIMPILFILLVAAPLHAADSADQDFSTNEYCISSGPGFAGKPINLRSGDETLTKTDLTLGTVYPITVNRMYNSRSGYDSPLGYGWALNHDRRLYTYADGSVTIRKECGWKRRFTLSGGTYISPVGDTGTLVQNADGTFTYTEKDGSRESYDLQGRLRTLADAKGNSLVYTYAGDTRDPLWGVSPFNINQSIPLVVSYDYRLTRIAEKDATGSLTGNWVDFQYNGSTGRLSGIQDNAGRSVSYGHDGIGNLESVTGSSGNASYDYNDPTHTHKLTNIDEGQGEYVNTYDAVGRVYSQTHGTGTIIFTYGPGKKTALTTTIKDSTGAVLNTRTRTVEFDEYVQVAKETDTYGNTTSYIRDSNAWVLFKSHTNIVSGITSTTAYTYDTKGNVLTRTDAQGTAQEKTTTYTYHPTFNTVETETVKSVVDPAQNRVVTNIYDGANGNLLTTTETGLLDLATFYTYTTTYGYNGAGQLTSVDGPRTDVQDVTSFGYDPITGYRTTMTQPIIGTTVYSNFNALGSPQTVTDPNGNSTIYTYYTDGKVSTVKAPGDTNATQYFYVTSCGASCSGKLDHIVLPEGNTITYGYDSLGNVATITDSLGNSINYSYDSEGNKIKEEIRDAASTLHKTLSYQYDALNRLSKIVNPDTNYTQYDYDSLGNRISLRTPNSELRTQHLQL